MVGRVNVALKKERNSLPTCQHCLKHWSYRETMKKLFRLRCPHCGQKNFQSRKFRWREPIFFLIVMIVNFVIFPFFSIAFTWKLVFLMLLLLAYFATLPFGLILSKEEESIF